MAVNCDSATKSRVFWPIDWENVPKPWFLNIVFTGVCYHFELVIYKLDNFLVMFITLTWFFLFNIEIFQNQLNPLFW